MLDPQPRRDHEQGGGAGLRNFDFFCFEFFLSNSATDIVLVTLPSTPVERAIARCTSRCAMARGHRLNTSIVLAAVHGLSGLFQAVSAVEPSLSRPLPPPSPPPNKQPRFCGRKATWSREGFTYKNRTLEKWSQSPGEIRRGRWRCRALTASWTVFCYRF